MSKPSSSTVFSGACPHWLYVVVIQNTAKNRWNTFLQGINWNKETKGRIPHHYIYFCRTVTWQWDMADKHIMHAASCLSCFIRPSVGDLYRDGTSREQCIKRFITCRESPKNPTDITHRPFSSYSAALWGSHVHYSLHTRIIRKSWIFIIIILLLSSKRPSTSLEGAKSLIFIPKVCGH